MADKDKVFMQPAIGFVRTIAAQPIRHLATARGVTLTQTLGEVDG